MARGTNLMRYYTWFVLALLVGSGVAFFMLAEYMTKYDKTCKSLGGIPVHGQGIDLCLKPEVLLGNDNG